MPIDQSQNELAIQQTAAELFNRLTERGFRQAIRTTSTDPEMKGDQLDALEHIEQFVRSNKTGDPSTDFAKLETANRIIDGARNRVLSRTDVVSDLPNRRALEEILNMRWAEFESIGTHFGVLEIDLNFFKPINDNHGHKMGDRAIRVAADSISSVSRAESFLARPGGDEMCMILPVTAEDMIALQYAKDDQEKGRVLETINHRFNSAIHNALKRRNLLHIWDTRGVTHEDGTPFYATIGFAHTGEDVKNVEELRELADLRMKRYKDRRKAARV